MRVATWNLYLGADLSAVFGDGRSGDLDTDLGEVVRQLSATPFEQRAPLVAQTLVAQQVDVVGLQEVCTWTYDGVVTADFEALLLAELAALGEEYDVVARQATFRGAADLPDALGAGRVPLTGHDVLMVRRGGPVRVESSHHGTFSQRLHLEVLGGHHQTVTRGWCAARCRVGEDGPGLTVVTTHTEAHGAQERDRQRDELLAAVDALAATGHPDGAGGRLQRPARGGRDAARAGRTPGQRRGTPPTTRRGTPRARRPTWPTTDSLLRQRIDYVFVRDAAVDGVRAGGRPTRRTGSTGRWPSDHAGVVAEVRLP